jgi:hypothetical protein
MIINNYIDKEHMDFRWFTQKLGRHRLYYYLDHGNYNKLASSL